MLILGLFALTLWWGGTALVWLLVRRTQAPGAAVWMLPVAGGMSLGVIHGVSPLSSVAASVIGFSAALVLWGALETAHLLGFLTGPEKRFCPAQLPLLERFRRGINVGLYHDLSILLALAVLWVLSWQGANPAAAWAFTVLWLMRWSAKLNLFLGVSNFDTGLMPERMRYMASYMQRRALNPLFPLSLGLGLLAAVLAAVTALNPAELAGLRAAATLAGTLAALGVIEHALMMLPVRDSQLWRWAAAQSADS